MAFHLAHAFDKLIEMLGTNLEPVKEGGLRNPLAIALAVGAVAAICLMLRPRALRWATLSRSKILLEPMRRGIFPERLLTVLVNRPAR